MSPFDAQTRYFSDAAASTEDEPSTQTHYSPPMLNKSNLKTTSYRTRGRIVAA